MKTNSKKIFLNVAAICLLVMVFTTNSLLAQSSMKTSEERAALITEKMKERLSLNDGQLKKIQEINLRYAKINEQTLTGSGNKLSKAKKLKSSMSAKDEEFKKVLDKDQYAEYKKMADEMKQQMREQFKQVKN
jgi:hypothetical protein